MLVKCPCHQQLTEAFFFSNARQVYDEQEQGKLCIPLKVTPTWSREQYHGDRSSCSFRRQGSPGKPRYRNTSKIISWNWAWNLWSHTTAKISIISTKLTKLKKRPKFLQRAVSLWENSFNNNVYFIVFTFCFSNRCSVKRNVCRWNFEEIFMGEILKIFVGEMFKNFRPWNIPFFSFPFKAFWMEFTFIRSRKKEWELLFLGIRVGIGRVRSIVISKLTVFSAPAGWKYRKFYRVLRNKLDLPWSLL